MRFAILFAVFCTLTACKVEGLLLTAPSELTTGVVLYENANFLGASAHLTSDVPDLRPFDGPCGYTDSSDGERHYDWNDCVSSLRVAPGWRATVYEHPNFRGEFFMTTGDTPNLQLVHGTCSSHGGLNDCVSSVRVVRVE
jgi:hypothetical protein